MSKRRPFGSVRKLPSGRWQARYQTSDGIQHRAPTTFASKVEAARFLSGVETDLSRGGWVDDRLGRRTLEEWSAEWLAGAVNLKPKTRYTYQGLLRRLIVPTLGRTALGDLRPLAVREWVASMVASGLSPSQVRQAYRLLSAMLRAAVECQLLVSSPCIGVSLPRLPAPRLRYLDADEIDRLAAEMPAPYGLLVYVLAYGGLRYGEAVALRRSHCLVLHGRLTVSESVAEFGGQVVVGPTKTHQARSVALPKFLGDGLAAHLNQLGAEGANPLVFPGPRGGLLRHGTFMRSWNAAATAAGLDATPHLLRHSCASLLINAGASVKDVQAHLGHATAAITLDCYAALIEGQDEALASKLDEVYRERSGTRLARRQQPPAAGGA